MNILCETTLSKLIYNPYACMSGSKTKYKISQFKIISLIGLSKHEQDLLPVLFFKRESRHDITTSTKNIDNTEKYMKHCLLSECVGGRGGSAKPNQLNE